VWTAALTTVVALSAAIAQADSGQVITVRSGGISRIQVVTNDTEQSPGGVADGWADIPDATAQFSVPSSWPSALLLLHFSGDASCPEGGICSARILVDGTEVQPATVNSEVFATNEQESSVDRQSRGILQRPSHGLVSWGELPSFEGLGDVASHLNLIGHDLRNRRSRSRLLHSGR
jgi:hypothetical protein